MQTIPSTDSPLPPRGKLLNVLGLAFGVAVTVGGCVGVGILSQPGTVAKYLPDPWWFLAAWLAGGVYVLLGALSVAELAAMTPRSGGYYVYVRRAMGEYAGFVIGWTHWLALCTTSAYVALALSADYIPRLIPESAGHERTVAILIVAGFAALQWPSVRGAGRVQEWTTLVKGLAFLALIVSFFILGGQPDGFGEGEAPAEPETATRQEPRPPAMPEGLALLAAAVLAFQAILQAYDGWEGAIYFGEEVRDPGRSLPRALIVGTLAVIVIYLGVNLALLHVLPLHRFAGHKLAVGLAAEEVFGANGALIFVALATVSILAVVNAGTLQTPRVLYAMSRDRLFFAEASRVNPGGTPTVALLLSTAAIIALLAIGSIDQLLALLGFFLVTNYSLLFVAVFVLRWREPHAERPYRAWGYPFTPALALAGSLVYLGASIATDETGSSLYALGLLAVSYPIYILVKCLGPPKRS